MPNKEKFAYIGTLVSPEIFYAKYRNLNARFTSDIWPLVVKWEVILKKHVYEMFAIWAFVLAVHSLNLMKNIYDILETLTYLDTTYKLFKIVNGF